MERNGGDLEGHRGQHKHQREGGHRGGAGLQGHAHGLHRGRRIFRSEEHIERVAFERFEHASPKLDFVRRLAAAGLREIEATSFVSPRAIPQLADASELLAALPRHPGVDYRALAPNRRGADRAIAAGVDEIVGLITSSETYNRKNSNMTIAENLVQVGEMADAAAAARVRFVMALSVSTFCPYEGEIPQERVLGLVERMREFGVRSYSLATSVGVA